MRKHTALITLISALIITGALAGCAASPVPEMPLRQAQTERTAEPNIISVSGVIESSTSRHVHSASALTVERVYVEVGDRVEAGQVLAVLDAEILELRAAAQRASLELARENSQNLLDDTRRMLNEATGSLANNTNMSILNAEAALNIAEVSLAEAKRNYAEALNDLEEGKNLQILNAQSMRDSARLELDSTRLIHENNLVLFESGILSAEQMRQSSDAFTHASNSYNDANTLLENALLMAERGVEQFETAVSAAGVARTDAYAMQNAARAAARYEIEHLRSLVQGAEISSNLLHMEIALNQMERDLKDTLITAPISGTVTAVIAREGDPAGGLMFVIEDIDSLRIKAPFREYDIARIYEGMEVIIRADATGDTMHKGIISRINPAATLGASVVEFETEIFIVSENAGLRIGMNARVEIGD